jgi:Tol biopolymer transport system component
MPGEPFAVSWSPDGERLVFVIRDETTPSGSIWTADVDGSDLAPLYGQAGECVNGAFWPVWAPDGRRLALVCYQDDGSETREATEWWTNVSVLDTATMTRTDVARMTWPESTDNPPSWSPDGTMLAFAIDTWDPTDSFITASTIATVPAAGGEITRLTDPGMFGGHPDWSPDGTRIAFNTYDTGNIHGIEEPSNVYTLAPDGSDLRQLSRASVDGKMRIGQPFWASDGSRIWVSVGRDWEKDSTGQFKNTLGWVDATTGELHEIGTEGKRFRERPVAPAREP